VGEGRSAAPIETERAKSPCGLVSYPMGRLPRGVQSGGVDKRGVIRKLEGRKNNTQKNSADTPEKEATLIGVKKKKEQHPGGGPKLGWFL